MNTQALTCRDMNNGSIALYPLSRDFSRTVVRQDEIEGGTKEEDYYLVDTQFFSTHL